MSRPLSISAEMRALVGRPFAVVTSEPITERDVRRWMRATAWPSEVADLELVEAPLDFNPFAGGPDHGPRPRGEEPDTFIEGRAGVTGPGSTAGVNGELEVTYETPMRIGDVISSVSKVVDYRIRVGAGHTRLLTDVETEWRNQDGRLILRQRNTTVRW